LNEKYFFVRDKIELKVTREIDMASIQITDLSLAGSALFSDSEGFMNDLSEKELTNVIGSGKKGKCGKKTASKSNSCSVSKSVSKSTSGCSGSTGGGTGYGPYYF
jgi:hypothetical protein